MSKAMLISPITKQLCRKTQVAAYCRVSSNSTDQQHSYANQIRVYTSYIEKRQDWELVEIFADEGISGMKAENRAEFQRMIRMCELRQIDLIITKSVARFARNAKEALQYVRKLKLLGVGVQFEAEGINTLALGDEMLLNTFSAIAQEESKAISQNQRLSIVKRMQNGEYVDSNAPYGYRLVNKKLTIFEPEAEIVREIFQLYLNGHSTSEIARGLNEQGIPTKTGKDAWRPAKIAYILGNERYIGDSLYQKTCRDTTVPFKQFVNRGQEDKFYARATHVPLLDRETFARVQELLKKRNGTFAKAKSNNTYPLTSRIQCSECGSCFRRRIAGGAIKWVCSAHKEDSKACESHYYSEERIYDGFIAMVNKLRFSEDDVLSRVIADLEYATLMHKKNNTAAREMSLGIAELNAKMLMLEQLRAKGYLPAEIYQSQAHDLNNQLSKLKATRFTKLGSSIQMMAQGVKLLKNRLSELECPLESFDEKLFAEIVKNVTINNHDEMTIEVKCGLRFTELI